MSQSRSKVKSRWIATSMLRGRSRSPTGTARCTGTGRPDASRSCFSKEEVFAQGHGTAGPHSATEERHELVAFGGDLPSVQPWGGTPVLGCRGSPGRGSRG